MFFSIVILDVLLNRRVNAFVFVSIEKRVNVELFAIVSINEKKSFNVVLTICTKTRTLRRNLEWFTTQRETCFDSRKLINLICLILSLTSIYLSFDEREWLDVTRCIVWRALININLRLTFFSRKCCSWYAKITISSLKIVIVVNLLKLFFERFSQHVNNSRYIKRIETTISKKNYSYDEWNKWKFRLINSFDKWKLLRKHLTNTKNVFATISKLDVVIESKICRCENWKTTSNVEWLLDELIRQTNELTRFIEKLVTRKIDWYRNKAIRDALRR